MTKTEYIADGRFEYETDAVIGKGAYGVVYKGLNTLTGEVVAVKVVDVKKMISTMNVGHNPQRAEAYLHREGDIMLKMDHENIVKTYFADTRVWYVCFVDCRVMWILRFM